MPAPRGIKLCKHRLGCSIVQHSLEVLRIDLNDAIYWILRLFLSQHRPQRRQTERKHRKENNESLHLVKFCEICIWRVKVSDDQTWLTRVKSALQMKLREATVFFMRSRSWLFTRTSWTASLLRTIIVVTSSSAPSALLRYTSTCWLVAFEFNRAPRETEWNPACLRLAAIVFASSKSPSRGRRSIDSTVSRPVDGDRPDVSPPVIISVSSVSNSGLASVRLKERNTRALLWSTWTTLANRESPTEMVFMAAAPSSSIHEISVRYTRPTSSEPWTSNRQNTPKSVTLVTFVVTVVPTMALACSSTSAETAWLVGPMEKTTRSVASSTERIRTDSIWAISTLMPASRARSPFS
mmetsp:Transcript_10323/g.28069  ORF Transcript_10323/g.28069 Transcript_10323/m.28069 type:complete len:352 (-) Transcript_10323:905-1960(-)